MKVGIISFAHMHAYGYAEAVLQLEGISLAGVTDDDSERGKQAAEQFGTTFYASLDDLLAVCDAVIVTSENAKHHGHVTAAALAGKAILCEKPLSTSIDKMEDMIRLCRERGVVLQTAFPVRFNASVIRAKRMIEEGRIGRILAIKGTNRGTNPGSWFVQKELSGGGAMIDHTVHVVDLMRWYMGAEVSEVYAKVDNLISNEDIDDCGILTMEFTNGVFATLDFSWSRNRTYPTWGDVTMEIVGTEGTLTVDATAQRLHVYSDENDYRYAHWGENTDFALVRDFIDSVWLGREPSITGIDGLRAVETALYGYESARLSTAVRIR